MRHVGDWGGKFIVPIPERPRHRSSGVAVMKVVLFCGGLGTRIREYSENIPKPMIPVGHQPILWHVMQYYSQYGHRDFVLCLGYKANVIKDFFLNCRPQTYCRLRRSRSGRQGRDAGRADRRTGASRWSTPASGATSASACGRCSEHVKDEEMFLANYSDGLTDVAADEMIERFKESGKIACFLAVRPPLTFHLADFDEDGRVREFRSADRVRHLDQRRLLHLPPRDLRLHARRRGAGARAVPAADRGRTS